MNYDSKVLVISYFFAPDAEIGAKRVTRFCRYLPGLGIQPIVVTVQERFLMRRDDSFPPPQAIRTERTTLWRNPYEWYVRLRKCTERLSVLGNASKQASATKASHNGRPGSFRRHVLTLLNTPDRFLGWYLPACKAAEKLIESEPIGVIFSSGPPWTTHLVARHLREKYKIPWAADFRDGWSTNPNLEGAPGWAQGLNARLEASCVRSADLVICNTEPLRRSFVRQYPMERMEKFVTLTNGFDDLARPTEQSTVARPVRVFLHFGAIYGRRRIDTFCRAINELVNARRLDPGSFKILFHGEIDASSLTAVHEQSPELIRSKTVEFEPFIDSWREAQELLWTADLLLLFPGSPVEIPAKFYEYLQTGKPMFAVGERGALSDLLESTGAGVWADPSDPLRIATSLLRALELPALPPEEVERRWSGQFHFRSLTAQLADHMRRLARH